MDYVGSVMKIIPATLLGFPQEALLVDRIDETGDKAHDIEGLC